MIDSRGHCSDQINLCLQSIVNSLWSLYKLYDLNQWIYDVISVVSLYHWSRRLNVDSHTPPDKQVCYTTPSSAWENTTETNYHDTYCNNNNNDNNNNIPYLHLTQLVWGWAENTSLTLVWRGGALCPHRELSRCQTGVTPHHQCSSRPESSLCTPRTLRTQTTAGHTEEPGGGWFTGGIRAETWTGF